MQTSYAAYSTEWTPDYFEQAKAALVSGGKIDFGILDEELQRNGDRLLGIYCKFAATEPGIVSVSNIDKLLANSFNLGATCMIIFLFGLLRCSVGYIYTDMCIFHKTGHNLL